MLNVGLNNILSVRLAVTTCMGIYIHLVVADDVF